MGFHADQEAVRILGKAIDYARLGLSALYGRPLPETRTEPRSAPHQTVSPGNAPDATER